MGRNPICSKEGLNKGAWTEMEDRILKDYIRDNGEGKWSAVPKKAGLKRCGKSCRLRWLNYLRPDIKRGNISEDEEELIIRLHKLLGNRWSLIAGRLPGRTDNEIKNYWNTIIGKKVRGHPVSTSASHRASPATLKNDISPHMEGSADQQADGADNTIETSEPGSKKRLDAMPEAAVPPYPTIGKDCLPGDFEFNGQFLSKLLGLDEEPDKVSSEIINQASSSDLNPDELMLCESDLQSLASFLDMGELETLPY